MTQKDYLPLTLGEFSSWSELLRKAMKWSVSLTVENIWREESIPVWEE